MNVIKIGKSDKKQLFWSMITTHSILPNGHSQGLLANVLTLDDLF